MAVENVVADDQPAGVVVDEVSADDEGLREASGCDLAAHERWMPHWELITENAPEKRLVRRRRDDQEVPDPREHERRQRVVDHRLVVHREGLHRGDRIEERAGAPRRPASFTTRSWRRKRRRAPLRSDSSWTIRLVLFGHIMVCNQH